MLLGDAPHSPNILQQVVFNNKVIRQPMRDDEEKEAVLCSSYHRVPDFNYEVKPKPSLSMRHPSQCKVGANSNLFTCSRVQAYNLGFPEVSL